jgi:hydrogenase maturation protease
MRKRYIIGVGNYHMADDGIGLRIVEHIVRNGLDRGFEAVDIADEGTRLLFYLERETEKIVLIDAVDMGLAAGEYRLFEPKDVDTTKEMRGLTTHQGDALKVIEFAGTLGYFIPPLVILGIQPGNLDAGLELSPPLRKRFDAYLKTVLEEIGKEG